MTKACGTFVTYLASESVIFQKQRATSTVTDTKTVTVQSIPYTCNSHKHMPFHVPRICLVANRERGIDRKRVRVGGGG